MLRRMVPISSLVPATFYAGDTVQWIEAQPSFPPMNGWVLESLLSSGTHHASVQSTDNGDGRHLIVMDTVFTGLLLAGDYQLVIAAVNSTTGERFTLATSAVIVKPNPSIGTDPRSHVKRTLDALEAWIESRNQGVAEYKIGDRLMKYWTQPELLQFLGDYRKLYKQELNAMRTASGKGSRRRLKVVMKA